MSYSEEERKRDEDIARMGAAQAKLLEAALTPDRPLRQWRAVAYNAAGKVVRECGPFRNALAYAEEAAVGLARDGVCYARIVVEEDVEP